MANATCLTARRSNSGVATASLQAWAAASSASARRRDARSDLEGVDLLERDRDPDGRLDPKLGPGVIQQEQAGSIEGHQLVEPLEHLPQRSIEVERRAQRGADLGQQPERWLGSRAAAMHDPKPGGNSATTALGLADRRVVAQAR